ncbi:hypothetical protein [Paremcibacter congregatus]|uniref:hypothetical protein n=1 Tax=Paremcibacter congregatus TaxID=2043170 RepID=UPI003A8F1860
MSDGPHYSLPARPRWKKAAEIADNAASSPEEICDAVSDALIADAKYDRVSELMQDIDECMEKGQGYLFASDTVGFLDQLADPYAGFELPSRALEFIQDEMRNGVPLQEAKENGLKDALMERAVSERRAMEEHYLNEAGHSRSAELKQRIDDGISRLPMQSIVQECIRSSGGKTSSRYQKKTGVEDGVPL